MEKINLIVSGKTEKALSNLTNFFDEIDKNQMNMINGGTVPIDCSRGYSYLNDNGTIIIKCKCGYAD